MKIPLRRDNEDYWIVKDKVSGEQLPGDEAIFILNSLIDNGFKVEFYYKGKIQGIETIRLGPFIIEITRITKSKIHIK